MPTIVVPAWQKCGIHAALSSSGGQQILSVITQVGSLYIILLRFGFLFNGNVRISYANCFYNLDFFLCLRCWSVHCPSIKRKMTASPWEESIPNFNQTDFLLVVSMKQCSVEGLCYNISHFFISVISHCPNSPSSAEFPEESAQFLHEKGHGVQRVKTNSAVQGILRNKDTIKAITLPELSVYYSFINLTKFVFS